MVASVDGEHAILEMIVDEAMRLTADGASLYVVKTMHCILKCPHLTLGIHFGGTPDRITE